MDEVADVPTLQALLEETRQLVLTADLSFGALALDELTAIDPHADVHSQLAPGIYLVNTDLSYWSIALRWLDAPPVFVRHICPVSVIVPLVGGVEEQIQTLSLYVSGEIVPWVEPALSFSVQTRLLTELPFRPFDVNQALSTILESIAGATLDVRSPEQVLSVVCGELRTYGNGVGGAAETVALIGLSFVEQNLSDWAGGMRRFAREEGQVSRAEFKLLEAIEVFDVSLPARGVVLDLGAAPGGWTRVLRQHEQYVTAVDPAELDPRVGADSRVRHKQMTAAEYLKDEPDQFDFIVNDMRMDGRDSARLMVTYARCLYAGGRAIMTVKLPGKNRRGVLDHVVQILTDAYTVVGARQLFHNRSEVTLYLQKVDIPSRLAETIFKTGLRIDLDAE